jgi:glycosyltransferase involved in cell wall biosynthesis
MKVLFLARYLPAEGSTTHMYELAHQLILKGHSVTILSSGPKKNDHNSKKIYDNAKALGINFVNVPFPNKYLGGFIGKLWMLVLYAISLPFAVMKIKVQKFDIVHAHYPVTTYIPAFLRFFNKKKKFIVTHHITGIPTHPLYRRADYAIAISDELEVELKTKYNYRETQVKKIYNGVSNTFLSTEGIDERNILKNKLYESNKFTIVFVGTLSQRKGIDILVHALELLDDDFQLVLVGQKTEFSENIINNSNIKNKIKLVGFTDPKEYLKSADIFVLPSRIEGFPLVTLEAMLSGSIVIRSDIEGAKTQVIDQVTGFLFENEDINSLSKIVSKVIKMNYEERSSIVQKSQQHALENFTSDKMVEHTLELYEEILIKK